MTPIRALVVLAIVCGLTACSGDSKETAAATGESEARPRVAFVTNGVASFWVIAQKGAEAGGKEFDADVSVHMPAAAPTQTPKQIG